MLIDLEPQNFCAEDARRIRLRVLEGTLRQASDGQIKLGDYADWLKAAGVPLPSRQSLRADLERYARACDDVLYGDHRKWLELDVHAGRDALRYFLGAPWVDAPLRPRLSSSACRCFLLAMRMGQEIEFQYAALPGPGLLATFKTHRGVPLRSLPGSDSGYMALALADGRIMHINLARVRGRVNFTGADTRHYQPVEADPEVWLCIRCDNRLSAERLAGQFDGRLGGDSTLRLRLRRSEALMNADRLEDWWRRTGTAPRQAERLLDLPEGRITFFIETEEE